MDKILTVFTLCGIFLSTQKNCAGKKKPVGGKIRHRMATTACFVIVSRNDIPIYEAEVGSAAKREDAAQLHQFILHAALDIVQDLAWTTSAMYLKAIDRFNDLVVSVYVTADIHTRLMLLHDSRNDDGIKSFFQEVHELYIKLMYSELSPVTKERIG
ncbi:SNARE-like superfamily protein [Prunus dulcis]|uniref:SNARE-like superfamily protein n=1 Tax=Prunus dulcis TaxID=3755 RepID=A0A4Y1QWL0_PRUDU|nr:SNARE-like superfamily protein [Prunus dulcis]